MLTLQWVLGALKNMVDDAKVLSKKSFFSHHNAQLFFKKILFIFQYHWSTKKK
jgi:hypothetical protein